jgi:hypothetical protein
MTFAIKGASRGIVCALALSMLSVAHADDAEVTLTRSFKDKESNRYKQVVKTTVAGKDIVLTSIDKRTIKEVKPNGDVVMTSENESNKVELDGAEQPGQPSPPSTVTYSKAGKLIDFNGGAAGFFDPGVQQLMIVAHSMILPDKPVKKDDTWKTELDDPAIKGKKITLNQTFLGSEKRDGKDLWKIKQTLEAPVDDTGDKASFELTFWLDPANGLLVHSEGSVKDLPSLQAGTISWTEETDLLKPDADKKTSETDKKAGANR